MSIKVNTILLHLQQELISVSGAAAERVHIGWFEPGRIEDLQPHFVILPEKQPGRDLDGEETERQLEVEIGVMAKIDQVDPAANGELQVNEAYEPVHAKLESMRHGVAGVFDKLEEGPDGPEYNVVKGKTITIRFVSCVWVVTYTRAIGAT